jgi:dephospho-CoA kinase
MKQVGITGGIGAGKSVVAKVFKSLGYPVYDADAAAKWCYANNLSLKNKVIDLFGAPSYHADGSLNRPFLAKQVFQNQEKLNQLNDLVHPAVKAHYQAWLQANKQSKLVFKEAAILMETSGYKQMDYTILVTAPIETRIARVIKRDNTTKEEVHSRINKQWSDEQKRTYAYAEIVNDETALILVQILALEQQLLQ